MPSNHHRTQEGIQLLPFTALHSIFYVGRSIMGVILVSFKYGIFAIQFDKQIS